MDPEYDVSKTVVIVEGGLITLDLFTNVNNNTRLEQALKTIRCGSLSEYCYVTISQSNGGRRQLRDTRELAGVVPIQIQFELSQDLYVAMDGITLEDSAFEQALATALGVPNDDAVTISSTGGVVTVYATISTQPKINPLDTTLIDAANNLQAGMETIIAALISALGNPAQGYVVGTTVDLCPPTRTCSYIGTCNPSTGVCACTGDYWGINCETPCTCNNGGYCLNVMCRCTFPWHGLRCDSMTDCDTCA